MDDDQHPMIVKKLNDVELNALPQDSPIKYRVINGQHRLEAFRIYSAKRGFSEEKKVWFCNIYPATLTQAQEINLSGNTEQFSKPDEKNLRFFKIRLALAIEPHADNKIIEQIFGSDSGTSTKNWHNQVRNSATAPTNSVFCSNMMDPLMVMRNDVLEEEQFGERKENILTVAKNFWAHKKWLLIEFPENLINSKEHIELCQLVSDEKFQSEMDDFQAKLVAKSLKIGVLYRKVQLLFTKWIQEDIEFWISYNNPYKIIYNGLSKFIDPIQLIKLIRPHIDTLIAMRDEFARNPDARATNGKRFRFYLSNFNDALLVLMGFLKDHANNYVLPDTVGEKFRDKSGTAVSVNMLNTAEIYSILLEKVVPEVWTRFANELSEKGMPHDALSSLLQKVRHPEEKSILQMFLSYFVVREKDQIQDAAPLEGSEFKAKVYVLDFIEIADESVKRKGKEEEVHRPVRFQAECIDVFQYLGQMKVQKKTFNFIMGDLPVSFFAFTWFFNITIIFDF